MSSEMKTIGILGALLVGAAAAAQQPELQPIAERVNIQADSARREQVIDGEWVAVGIRKPEALCRDYTRMYDGKPSFRFTLGAEDNTLKGYSPGETKGRSELSYCYATAADFAEMTPDAYAAAQKMKTVYHHGKGICPQGTAWRYTFAVYVPKELDGRVSTIFAQWHGMPDRTLVTDPDGRVRQLSTEEFVALYDTVVIKKEVAYRRVEATDRKGGTIWKAGDPTGWKVEQGGYPPLAFGFSGGWFYIKANSDRRWFTDKDDRCNANPEKAGVMQPVTSEFKASTIAAKMPFAEFPKDRWVTFTVEVRWTRYGGEAETILQPGRLDVAMLCDGQSRKLVDNREILIGRNDEAGYYFKYGIYRVAGSTVPVSYNLAGFAQQPID